MIIDYKIVAVSQYDALERSVKKWLEKGWEPLGSPFTTDLHRYNQAIVMCDEEYEEEWQEKAETIR